MKALDALASLKDIDGVYGSFVVDGLGELTLRDLPAVIDNSALRDAGPRIARLWGAFPDEDAPEYVLLEFSAHQLFIRKLDAGSLCVFVPPSVNRQALKMATSFVARWLDAELPAFSVQAEPSPASEPAAPAALSPEPLRGRTTTYFYRGQRYDG